jgi:UDP-N-acetylglucosamine--N-acetylmuramyl-(pentapeptide) pyrophosphoryl-undecaprenol N-acetylglucosamine transferase
MAPATHPHTGPARVFFAGGGTGGHLYPGLAIARAMVRLAPSVQPHFIGARRGIEKEVLPGAGFPFTLLDLHPLYRQRPWDNWKTLAGAFSAWRAIAALARTQRPRAVIGTGGYAAGVALAWGRANDVPTMLHEPDSHPWLTTRVFAKGAHSLFLGFPEAADRLTVGARTRVHSVGCPIEPPPVPRRSRTDARAAWGLPADAFVVLVTGGSQGARALNDAVAAWVAGGLPDQVALIWATGRGQAAAYLDREAPMVRVRPYLSPIADAYAAADVAITRAGAMSIAEQCAWGIPAVLVPLPTAAQDHQTHNARATAAAGAAVHLPQAELSATRLDQIVRAMQRDPAQQARMRAAAELRAHPGAADAIARSILGAIGAL